MSANEQNWMDPMLSTESPNKTRSEIMNFKKVLADASHLLIQSHKDKFSSKTTTKKTKSNKTSDPETYSQCLTDVHFGKKILDVRNNSQNVLFNYTIGTRYLNHIFQEHALSYLTDNYEKVDEYVLYLLGDLIEGDGNIYSEQGFEIESNVVDQIFQIVNILLTNIRLLYKETKGNIPIRIYAVQGNHGEIRGRFIKHALQNYDIIIYRMIDYYIRQLQEETGEFLNISIEYPKIIAKEDLICNIKGWKYYLRHILPRNFTTPSSQDKIQATSNFYNNLAVVLTGHLHQESLATIGDTTVIRVNALCGYDAFANKINAPYSSPSQVGLVTTKKDKIKAYLPINLGNV
jgi:predicted phosphodiesterase